MICSDKYGKYLFKINFNGPKLFIWGRFIENDNVYFLSNELNTIIFFSNFQELKKYVFSNVRLEEMKEWVICFPKNKREIKELIINPHEYISENEILDDTKVELWYSISLFIEFFEDLILFNDDSMTNILNSTETLDKFNMYFDNNFIWKNEEKKEFKISSNFILLLAKMSLYVNKKVMVQIS